MTLSNNHLSTGGINGWVCQEEMLVFEVLLWQEAHTDVQIKQNLPFQHIGITNTMFLQSRA